MIPSRYSGSIGAAANEMNNLFQLIGNSAQMLLKSGPVNREVEKQIDTIMECVKRGAETTSWMMDTLAKNMPPVAETPAMPAGRSVPLPRPKPDEPLPSAAGGGAEEIRIANPNGPREMIMIVDDEAVINFQAERILTSEGYRVVSTTDAFQAISIYRRLKDQISLVILDFVMPVMDGSEVFDELRLINPHVPVMLSTGFAEQDKLKSMLAKGLRGFLPKPYTYQKLLSQLRSTLDAMKRERTSWY